MSKKLKSPCARNGGRHVLPSFSWAAIKALPRNLRLYSDYKNQSCIQVVDSNNLIATVNVSEQNGPFYDDLFWAEKGTNVWTLRRSSLRFKFGNDVHNASDRE